MVTMSHTVTPMTVNPNDQQMNLNDSTPNVSSDYEKCRQQRIKENLERMQKLGIYDLSLKMKSVKPNTNRRNNKPINPNQNKTPLPSPVPTRRSSRLQNTPTVSYTEVVVSKKGKESSVALMMENSRPEVYTEEHEKLLGDAKTEWTLFVDGYGKDGKKIYDQVRGKTCHQCRQKTLGHRTHCIKCNLVQGQFCGDCLYMRLNGQNFIASLITDPMGWPGYGENVLEAMKRPDWICPVCRGICNCSLCRQAKGWAPTGVMYKKISSIGYKSVAHYFIQTRRADPNAENNEKSEIPVCAKRSLPFSSEEVESKDDVARNENIEESKLKNSEAGVESENGIATKKVITDEKSTELQSSYEQLVNIVKLESDQESKSKNLEIKINEGVNENKNKVAEKLTELQSSDEPLCDNVKLESDQEPKIKNLETEIGEGVNENKNEVSEKLTELQSSDEPLCDNAKLESDQELINANLEAEINEGGNENKNKVSESEVHLKFTNLEYKINNTDDEVATAVTSEAKPGSRKKRIVPLGNSIAGRLRSRRKCT